MTRPTNDPVYGRTLALPDRPQGGERVPLVLVHGAPDTAAVWDALRAELPEREAIALALPGFGVPRPEGFGATRWEYRDWLVRELEAIGGPVDAVGHDQGSVVLQAVVREQPHLVRSWVLGGGVSDAEYLWHPQARVWQTSGAGEQSRDAWLALDHQRRVQLLVAAGMPVLHAERAARHVDREMLDSILALYRSEPWLGDWEFEAGRDYPPGMVVWGERDPFQAVDFGRRAARAAGADLVTFDCGHWWQLERPSQLAGVLRRFWEGLQAGGVSRRLRLTA